MTNQALTARFTRNNAEWAFMTDLLRRKGLQWLLNSVSIRHQQSAFYVTDEAGDVVFEYRAS